MLRKLRGKSGQQSNGRPQDCYRRRAVADPAAVTSRRSNSRRGETISHSVTRSNGTTSSLFNENLRKAWDAESKAIALWDFRSERSCDLTFKRGDSITVLTRTGSQFDWWEGALNERVGIFPANYVKLVDSEIGMLGYLEEPNDRHSTRRRY